MTLQEIVNIEPKLLMVTPSYLSNIVNEIFSGYEIDFTKTWGDQGYDDLDCVEILMRVEKDFDIIIQDDVSIYLFEFNVYPPNFSQFIRDSKLEQLGIK